MNKHDIEELQAFLQGEYIEESTSRSLKEVKQYQNQQHTSKNYNDMQKLKIFLRHHLTSRNDGSYVCSIRKDIDCKTDEERAMFEVLKNIARRYYGYSSRKSIEDQPEYKPEKHRLIELFGFDAKNYGIEDPTITDDWCYFKLNRFNDVNKIFPMNRRAYYRFIHFTRKSNLTSINPSYGSSHFDSGYADATIFFFAVRRDAYMPDVLRRGLNYGKYVYEYIPKSTDKIYLDFTDTKPKIGDSVIPVYIETKRSLPVKQIEYDRDGFKESYIDETIERFDVFMEEFNSGQISNSEFIMESVLSRKYAKITKEWMTRNKLQWFYYDRNEKFDDPLPDEVVDYLFNLVWKLKRCDKNCNFKAYKTIYDEFCEITHYPNNTCIMGNMINNNGKINMGSSSMHLQRLKPAYLKTGIHLFHASDDPNLTVLTPDHFVGMNQYIHLPNGKNAFIGKDTYYAFPRAYFYIETSGTRYGFNKASRFQYDSNNMPIINDTNKQDGHLYMYITKFGDRIYIDNELASKTKYATIGTPVFMLVSKPIKLIKIY